MSAKEIKAQNEFPIGVVDKWRVWPTSSTDPAIGHQGYWDPELVEQARMSENKMIGDLFDLASAQYSLLDTSEIKLFG